MTAPGTAGADDAEIFKQLAGILRIPVTLGSQADAENTAADRIVFVPVKLPKPKALKYSPPDGDGIAEQHRAYRVSIYGADWGRLCRVHREFYAALDDILSFTGFEMGDSEEPKGGGPGEPSWGVIVPVTIKGPIYRKFWIDGVSRTVTSGLVVTKPDGTGAEEVPS